MYSTVDEIREVFEENDIGNEAVITDAEIIRIITECRCRDRCHLIQKIYDTVR